PAAPQRDGRCEPDPSPPGSNAPSGSLVASLGGPLVVVPILAACGLAPAQSLRVRQQTPPARRRQLFFLDSLVSARERGKKTGCFPDLLTRLSPPMRSRGYGEGAWA